MARGMFLGQVIGNLTRDPESRYLANGTPVAGCTIAVNTDKDGEPTFVKVSAFGKLSEVVSNYLRKGSGVFVSGNVKVREYTNNEGIKRTSVDIDAQTVQLLDKKGENEGEQTFASGAPRQAATYSRSAPRQVAPQFGLDEELPF